MADPDRVVDKHGAVGDDGVVDGVPVTAELDGDFVHRAPPPPHLLGQPPPGPIGQGQPGEAMARSSTVQDMTGQATFK